MDKKLAAVEQSMASVIAQRSEPAGQVTHTWLEWVNIAHVLSRDWNEVAWPSGSVQRSAAVLAFELMERCNTSIIEHRGFTHRIDPEDWDTSLALALATKIATVDPSYRYKPGAGAWVEV